MREADFEKKVVKAMAGKGALSIKLNGMGRRGWPDRLFVQGKRVAFVEFKSDKGYVTTPQRHCAKQLHEKGFEVTVLRPNLGLAVACERIEEQLK